MSNCKSGFQFNYMYWSSNWVVRLIMRNCKRSTWGVIIIVVDTGSFYLYKSHIEDGIGTLSVVNETC